VTVRILDAANNLTNSTANVTIAADGLGPFASGTTTVAAVGGVATFSDLKITKAGDYQLIASGMNGTTDADQRGFEPLHRHAGAGCDLHGRGSAVRDRG
jgi:hypothetical protein